MSLSEPTLPTHLSPISVSLPPQSNKEFLLPLSDAPPCNTIVNHDDLTNKKLYTELTQQNIVSLVDKNKNKVIKIVRVITDSEDKKVIQCFTISKIHENFIYFKNENEGDYRGQYLPYLGVTQHLYINNIDYKILTHFGGKSKKRKLRKSRKSRKSKKRKSVRR